MPIDAVDHALARLQIFNQGYINAIEQVKIGQEVVEGQIGRGSRYIPLWPYAVGFCLAVLMLEWWMYHRKIIV